MESSIAEGQTASEMMEAYVMRSTQGKGLGVYSPWDHPATGGLHGLPQRTGDYNKALAEDHMTRRDPAKRSRVVV